MGVRTVNGTSKLKLSALTDAELGRMVRAGLLSVLVDEAGPARERALAERRERDTVNGERKAAHMATRGAMVLPAFTVGHVTVPALDLGAVDENTVVAGRVRSQYNAVMHRLGMTGTVDPECTYAELADFHVLLSRRAANDDGKAEDRKAKKEALMEVLGLSQEQAEEILR